MVLSSLSNHRNTLMNSGSMIDLTPVTSLLSSNQSFFDRNSTSFEGISLH